MSFKTINEVGILINEMTEKIEQAKKTRFIVEDRDIYTFKGGFKHYAIINDTRVKISLTTYDEEREQIIKYTARKDSETEKPVVFNGGKMYATLQKYYQIPVVTDFNYSAAGVLYRNPKYDGKTRFDDCYGYDINSSYSWGMIQDMPDTKVKPRFNDYLKENEIGLDTDFKPLTEVGDYAFMIWPKIESPFKRFVEVWYNRKKNAKTPEEKQHAKGMLNVTIGYLQRKNPVLRTFIIGYANARILNLIDSDTLYCNTDSIISKRRRLDIEQNLGTEIGQWKLENQGSFAYKGFNYQWTNKKVSYRGVAKTWFNDDYDILTDILPSNGNLYYYDKTERKLKKYEKTENTR